MSIKMSVEWEELPELISIADRILLESNAGYGKSRIAREGREGLQTLCIPLNGQTDETHLIGMYTIRGNSTKWQHGVGPRAWLFNEGEGCGLVLDEVEKCGEDGQQALLAVCDGADVAKIVLPSGKEIRPGPKFHVIATCNDSSTILPPLLDRFTVHVRLTEPNPAAIDALPEDLRKIATATITSGREDAPSLRKWHEYARLRTAMAEKGTPSSTLPGRALFGEQWQSIMDHIKLAS